MCHRLQWHEASLTAPAESWPLAMWFETLRAAAEGNEVNGNPALVGSGLKLSYESWISEGWVQHICVGVRQPRGVCSEGKDKLHSGGLGVSPCLSFAILGKTWDTAVMKAALPSPKGATRRTVHPLACSWKHQKPFLAWEIFAQGGTVAVCNLAAKHAVTESPLAVLTPRLPLVVQRVPVDLEVLQPLPAGRKTLVTKYVTTDQPSCRRHSHFPHPCHGWLLLAGWGMQKKPCTWSAGLPELPLCTYTFSWYFLSQWDNLALPLGNFFDSHHLIPKYEIRNLQSQPWKAAFQLLLPNQSPLPPAPCPTGQAWLTYKELARFQLHTIFWQPAISLQYGDVKHTHKPEGGRCFLSAQEHSQREDSSGCPSGMGVGAQGADVHLASSKSPLPHLSISDKEGNAIHYLISP